MRFFSALLLGFILIFSAAAQDSVDVTFRYFPTGNPSVVHLPGEFNNWANNSGGAINPGALWTMAKQPDGSWVKTIRLETGGGSGPGGSYQYKLNEGGTSTGWLSDPLNPLTFGSYGNSIIYVRRPTIFHPQPLDGSIVGIETPELVAEIFPVTTQIIDTGASYILVDGQPTGTFGNAYDPSTGFLRLTLPPLSDGEHTVTVIAAEPRDYETRDSTRFTIRAAALQWLTRDNPHVMRSQTTIDLTATGSGISDVIVVRNGVDSITATLNGNVYSSTVMLEEGDNSFIAYALKDGLPIHTTELILHRVIDHTPIAVIQLGSSSGNINLNAAASTDPDGDNLQFHWLSDDGKNPAALSIDQDGALLSFPVPVGPGEYYFTLEARDPANNIGIARNYIRVSPAEGEPALGALNENPAWVRDAVVYEIFVPAFSSNGNLQGVIDGIPRMKTLGVNTLWLMPIMDNLGSINSSNGGYNIVDFYNVDESIGTIEDFDRLVDSCHANGMKIILDMTPNHVSGSHPWVDDIRDWRDYSIYRPFIETRILGSDRGLGQSVVMESTYALYARYSNWNLANLNLSNEETRRAMMDVHRFWLVDRKADGFRLDVYWGPQERYGASTWWRPFREEIKRYKPEVFLLGETDGTGGGSEFNYADAGGALDAGYDWNWYGQIKGTLGNGDIAALNSRTTNYSPNDRYNHYTGPNAHYFRFLENHDEDRIAQMFQSNAERTKPGAVVMLTAPGIPMLYAGQEIGWKGRRDRISFSNPPQPGFLPFYRNIIRLRTSYASLRSPRISQILHGTPGTYAYLRPGVDENIVVTANFREIPVSVTMTIPQEKFDLAGALQPGTVYYLNDLSVDSTFSVTPEGLAAFSVDLAPFQSRIFLFSDSAMYAIVTSVEQASEGDTRHFSIDQCYPNPVPAGGSTSVRYSFGGTPGSIHEVRLDVFDGLGRMVWHAPMIERTTGTHTQPLNLSGLAPGQYRLRIYSRDSRTQNQWSDTRGITILR